MLALIQNRARRYNSWLIDKKATRVLRKGLAVVQKLETLDQRLRH